MRNNIIRIEVDDESYLDYTPSASPSSPSTFSTASSIVSPLSNRGFSPNRVPTANRIMNLISNAIPFQDNTRDDYSLPSYYSDSVHSENSFYNAVVYNYGNFIINFTNIFIFALYSIINDSGTNSVHPDEKSLFFYAYSQYPYCENVKKEVWRLFTYSLVHANIVHLIANSLGILITTFCLYRYQSIFNTLLIYFCSVVNGAFYFYLTNPYDILIGASGGVFGLLGSMISNNILNNDNMSVNDILLSNSVILIFLFFETIGFFTSYNKNVAYQVHWSCLLNGLLLGLSNFRIKKKKKYKSMLKYFSLILYCYYTALIFYNFIFSTPSFTFNYFKIQEPNSCCYLYNNFNNMNNTLTFSCNDIKKNDLLFN